MKVSYRASAPARVYTNSSSRTSSSSSRSYSRPNQDTNMINTTNIPDVKSFFSSLYPVYIPNNYNIQTMRTDQRCPNNPELICSGTYPVKVNKAQNLEQASRLMGGLPVSFARLDINNLQATKSFRTLRVLLVRIL